MRTSVPDNSQSEIRLSNEPTWLSRNYWASVNRTSRRLSPLVWSVWFAVMSIPACYTRANDIESRALMKMVELRLYDSSIAYCNDRIERAVEPSQQAGWAMHLMDVYTQIALAENDESKWLECDKAANQFLERYPEHNRRWWIQWKLESCRLLKAQALLAQYLAAPSNLANRESILELIRVLLRNTEIIAAGLEDKIPLLAREVSSKSTDVTVEQAHQLLLDLRLLECEALLVRARLYPAFSPDSIAAASEVDRRASEIVGRTDSTWASRDQVLLAKISATLQIDGSLEPLAELEQLARSTDSEVVRERAAVVAIEQLAGRGEVSRAAALLPLLEDVGSGPSLALCELQIALAEVDAEGDGSTLQLERVASQAASIGDRYGDYWRNRAEALLIEKFKSTRATSTAAADDLLAAEVRQLLVAGDIDGAVKRLVVALDMARDKADGASAIRYASQASLLLQERERWKESADLLEPVVKQFASASVAATQGQRMVLLARSKAIGAVADKSVATEDLLTTLETSLVTWPDDALATEADRWLRSILVGAKGDVRYLAAIRQWIQACHTQPAVATACFQWFKSVCLLESNAGLDEELAKLEAVVDEASATKAVESQGRLIQFVVRYASAFRQWKRGGTVQVTSYRNEWPTIESKELNSIGLSIVQAAVVIEGLRRGDLEGVTRSRSEWNVDGLPTDMLATVVIAAQEAIDELPLAQHAPAVQALDASAAWLDDLVSSKRTAMQIAGHRLIAWTRSVEEGLSGLQRLAQQYPTDLSIQLALSNALASSGRNRLAESTDIAKRIAARTKPGNEFHLGARWRWIKNLREGGQQLEAKKAAQLLLATQPNLDSWHKQRLQAVAESQ